MKYSKTIKLYTFVLADAGMPKREDVYEPNITLVQALYCSPFHYLNPPMTKFNHNIATSLYHRHHAGIRASLERCISHNIRSTRSNSRKLEVERKVPTKKKLTLEISLRKIETSNFGTIFPMNC